MFGDMSLLGEQHPARKPRLYTQRSFDSETRRPAQTARARADLDRDLCGHASMGRLPLRARLNGFSHIGIGIQVPP